MTVEEEIKKEDYRHQCRFKYLEREKAIALQTIEARYDSAFRLETETFNRNMDRIQASEGRCSHGKSGPHKIMGEPVFLWETGKDGHYLADGCDPPHMLLGASYVGSNDCPGSQTAIQETRVASQRPIGTTVATVPLNEMGIGEFRIIKVNGVSVKITKESSGEFSVAVESSEQEV